MCVRVVGKMYSGNQLKFLWCRSYIVWLLFWDSIPIYNNALIKLVRKLYDYALLYIMN